MKVPPVLTVEETAKLLRVTTKTIYRWIRRGVIPAKHYKRQRGKPYRIAKCDLEKIVGPL